MYSGKHARPGGAGSRRDADGPDLSTAVPRQAGEARALNEVSLDDLRAEDALDRSSHDDLHRLLGSIHLGGIRLQSPIYLAGSRAPARRPDDTIPLVRV